MNPNSNVFASRISDAYTMRNNVSSIMNPKERYVKVDREAPRPAADNPEEAYKRDKRSQAPVSTAPVKQTPVDPKPQSNQAVNPDDGQTKLGLEFSKDTLLSGFIMSEVLGRPKCFGSHRRTVRR